MTTKQAYKLLKSQDVDGFNAWVKEWRKSGKKSIDLDDKDLSGLKLKGADLADAHLNGSNLRGTNLEGANLVNARLRQADLRKACLRGADLSNWQGCGQAIGACPPSIRVCFTLEGFGGRTRR